jgi:hypothetical protein
MKIYIKAINKAKMAYIGSFEIDIEVTCVNIAYYLRKRFGSIQALNRYIKGFVKEEGEVYMNVYHTEERTPITAYKWDDIVEEFKKHELEDRTHVVAHLALKVRDRVTPLLYSTSNNETMKSVANNTVAMRCGYSVATLKGAVGINVYSASVNSRIIHDASCNRYYLHMSNDRKSDVNKTDVFIHLITE